jgi:NADP-dependent 3-hydroxy acid dehydrogenase YdfG
MVPSYRGAVTDAADTPRRLAITGAGGVIGQAILVGVARPGDTVVLLGRGSESGEQAAAALRATGVHVDHVVVDLADPSSVHAAAAELAAAPALDVLIHAAGHHLDGPVIDVDEVALNGALQVIVTAPYTLTRAALPGLISARGMVVFLNSTRITQSLGGHVAYGLSKTAQRAMADGLRDELSVHGVRVSSVVLGSTASEFQRRRAESMGHPYHPASLLQPGDVAAVVALVVGLPRTGEITDVIVRPGLHPSRRTAAGPTV